MAENRKLAVVRRNIAFIQQSIVAGGLATVAGYLLQSELITRQNHDDALAPCGRGPVDQAAMLMRTVELKIESNPDLYFPRFTAALRWSNLGNVADTLEQALPEHQRVPGIPEYTRKSVAIPCKLESLLMKFRIDEVLCILLFSLYLGGYVFWLCLYLHVFTLSAQKCLESYT